jgi:hypothetical protein
MFLGFSLPLGFFWLNRNLAIQEHFHLLVKDKAELTEYFRDHIVQYNNL